MIVPVLLFLLLAAFAFVIDCIVAFFCKLIAPATGLEFIQGLDFWNWFWIVILVSLLSWTSSAASANS